MANEECPDHITQNESVVAPVAQRAIFHPYPPRNDRTNKALRALGHDVVVFDE